ncbi:MAG: hypothetical protein N2690_13250, partial [Rhodocyclaceae bacterium]|nr:hypothetical protein [Rhodocyclaceae bacterium]
GVSLSEADCRDVHSALHGNAFELTFLATELQREASARDVQALIWRVIANPRDIFRPTIERLKREPDWDNVIEPALGVLLSAQEPLSAPALAGILAQKYHRVQDAITRLRGLLGEQDREGQPRYYLLHLKLIEHLKSEIFAGKLTAYHDQLARWCERDLARIWQPAQDSDEVERRA